MVQQILFCHYFFCQNISSQVIVNLNFDSMDSTRSIIAWQDLPICNPSIHMAATFAPIIVFLDFWGCEIFWSFCHSFTLRMSLAIEEHLVLTKYLERGMNESQPVPWLHKIAVPWPGLSHLLLSSSPPYSLVSYSLLSAASLVTQLYSNLSLLLEAQAEQAAKYSIIQSPERQTWYI